MLTSVMIDQAAELLGVSRRTVYYRIREGRLLTIRTPGGSQRVLLASIQALLREDPGAFGERGAAVSGRDSCARSPVPQRPAAISATAAHLQWTGLGGSTNVRVWMHPPPAVRTCVVADDHPAIVALITRVLAKVQFQVFPASDGRKALSLLAEHPSCHLLVTDLAMPEGEGIETIRAVRTRYPAVKILAISGAFGANMLRTAQLLGADATLGKPFTSETLIATVEALFAKG